MKLRSSPTRQDYNSSLTDELCGRLEQETGLAFQPVVGSAELPSYEQIKITGEGQEITLGYTLPDGEKTGVFTRRLLTVIAQEIWLRFVEETRAGESEHAWGWEKLLSLSLEEQWDEKTIEARAREYALPELGLGLPILIRFHSWHRDIPQVIRNLLPDCSIFWVRQPEIFVFTKAGSKRHKILAWGEALVQDVHTIVADELGVLSTVLVGHPAEKRPWRSYAELQAMMLTYGKFFRGETGLVAWKQGLAGLLAGVENSRIQSFRGEVFRDQLGTELSETLEMYLTHGLSAAETARALYIHRNTLIYRLDRITELTGYNPRNFEDAVHLYLALWLQQKLHD